MMKLSWKHCIIYCMKSTLNKVKQNIIYLISCRSYFENIFQKRLMIFDKQSKFSEMQVWNHQHFKMLLGFCTMKFIIDTIPYMKLNINWIPHYLFWKCGQNTHWRIKKGYTKSKIKTTNFCLAHVNVIFF